MNLADKAKQTLVEFVPRMDKVLAEIWESELADVFGYNAKQIEIAREMIEHSRSHNLAPSKRIRSAFVYYGYKLAGGESEKIWRAAAAVELVHTALLMHDDFMDEDQLRRGRETTNAYYERKFGRHYGDVMAVNVGDMVLSMGYEKLANCGMKAELVVEAMAHLQRTIVNTAIGQAEDNSLGHWENWTEEDVLAVHRAKTGLYTYENPLMVGAILGGLQLEARQLLQEYARDGGLAFQLQDDILGVFGNPAETGKSADSDLIQGKATLLVLKAMGQPEVKRVWGNKDASETEIEKAKQAIKACGAYEYNVELAKNLAGKAVQTAEKLRNMNLDTEAADFLAGIAQYTVERKV